MQGPDLSSATCLSAITIARYDVLIIILTLLVLFAVALGWVCACFLVRHQVIDRTAFWKKRAIPIVALALFSFALGWVCACFRVHSSADARIASFEDEQAKAITRVRQRIYGTNYFHCKGISPGDDARLERFDPAGSKGFITMSYVGGFGGIDTDLKIEGNGSVSVTQHGASRKVAALEKERCADFFMRVITSGILNYSDGVIELKQDLAEPRRSSGVTDRPMTRFRISVPELDIEKGFSIYDVEHKLYTYPDMIEYHLVDALEKEILSFIPKDDPFWK